MLSPVGFVQAMHYPSVIDINQIHYFDNFHSKGA